MFIAAPVCKSNATKQSEKLEDGPKIDANDKLTEEIEILSENLIFYNIIIFIIFYIIT